MANNTSKQVQEIYGKDATYDTERQSIRNGAMKKTFDRWGDKKTKEYLDVEISTRIAQDKAENEKKLSPTKPKLLSPEHEAEMLSIAKKRLTNK